MAGNSRSGRKAEPTALKLLKGTAKRGDVGSEPTPAGEPVEPKWKRTDTLARKFWRDNVPILVELGIATDLDQYALEFMCELYQQSRRARKLRERRLHYAELVQLMKSFGMMPAERVRLAGLDTVAAKKKQKAKSGAARFFAG